MTDLFQSLLNSEFSYLKAVAEKWGLPFDVPDARQGLETLVESLLDPQTHSDLENTLTKEEKEALVWLDDRGGRESWDHFRRQYGDIREVGAGRLDRERPDLEPISPAESLWYRALIARGFFEPISPAESLWYRALIARGFFETEDGPQEFVFIPDDLRELTLPNLNPDREGGSQEPFLCRKAAPKEMVERQLATAAILDHTCTLLAGLRMELDPGVHLPEISQGQIRFYHQLYNTAGLLSGDKKPDPERIREFFELPRDGALLNLYKSWLKSDSLQDFLLVPGIEVEGDPELDPIRVRKFILRLMEDLDPETWWSLESFLAQTRELHPDFLRSGGEYDSWFIKKAEADEFLRGFENWDLVEGAYLRYLITGPLHWLGLIDLGIPKSDADVEAAAFRLSPLGKDLMKGDTPQINKRIPERVQVRAKGEIRLTENIPHKVRYQISRFCDWESYKAEAYYYKISPESLNRAEGQGLRVAHLLSLLKAQAETIPPNILKALEHWEKVGAQAVVSRSTVLRLGSPAILKSLKKSKASRFILEQIGPTTVIVKEGSEEKIAEALVEMGFFLDWKDQTGSQS
jgi:hypothetical protein